MQSAGFAVCSCSCMRAAASVHVCSSHASGCCFSESRVRLHCVAAVLQHSADRTDLSRGHLGRRHAGRPLGGARVIGPRSPAGLVDADGAAAGGSGALQHVGPRREGPPQAAGGGGVAGLRSAPEGHIALCAGISKVIERGEATWQDANISWGAQRAA